jgi:hypothetical protein
MKLRHTKDLETDNEEYFKIQILKNDPYYEDREVDGEIRSWSPRKKYDIISPEKDFIIEVKPDDPEPEEPIFQAIVTAVKNKNAFNWYGCHTKYNKKCVPTWAIDQRLIALHDLTPSKKTEEYKTVYNHLKPSISANMRDFPPHEERLQIIKCREWHNSISEKDFQRLKNTNILFPHETDILLNTENWRISSIDRETYNAFYTPVEVVEKVRQLLCKHWVFKQIWDCAAGDGHLISWFDNILLSDINPAIVVHGGTIADYLKLKAPIKLFDIKDGIMVVNPSYKKLHIKHLIDLADKHKLRLCIGGPPSAFPVDSGLPIVDGFFSSGWGNGGEGRKERGQLILLLDFRGDTPKVNKTTLSDGTVFECVPDSEAIKTKRGYIRYGCTAAESMDIAKDLGINLFATCSKDISIVGRFLSNTADNYKCARNGKGGRHGYGKSKRKNHQTAS